jgi:hypothetical protein
MQLSRSLILEVHLVPHGRAIHTGTKLPIAALRHHGSYWDGAFSGAFVHAKTRNHPARGHSPDEIRQLAARTASPRSRSSSGNSLCGQNSAGSRESARPFKGIICDDISEFESYHLSHAVWSPPGRPGASPRRGGRCFESNPGLLKRRKPENPGACLGRPRGSPRQMVGPTGVRS